MKSRGLVAFLLALVLGCFVLFPSLVVAENKLVFGANGEAHSLHPYFITETPTNSVNQNMYDTLIFEDKNLNLVPSLAVKWEATDSTRWTFHLRKNVRFHDGTPFTAADVKFSVEHAAKWPKSMWQSTVSSIASTEIIDDHTVQFTTKKPFGIFPGMIAQLMIISKKYIEKHGAEYSYTKPIGTGPYKLKEWIKGDHLTLVVNEDHWRGVASIKEVVIRPLSNNATRTAALLSREVQLIEDVPVLDVKRLKTIDTLDVISRSGLRCIYLAMDLVRAKSPKVKGKAGENPMTDVRVRKAMAMAIDEDAIIKHVMNGYAVSASNMYPDVVFGYDPSIKRPPFDLERAGQLMKEAGYADGFSVTLDGTNDRYVNDSKIMQAVAVMLSKINIKVKVNARTKILFFPDAFKGSYSFHMVGWSCGPPDAIRLQGFMAHTQTKDLSYGKGNWVKYSNPKVDKYIEASDATVDANERLKNLQAAQKIFLVEDQLFIPLHFQVDIYAKNKNLNWQVRPDHMLWYYAMSWK